MRSSYIDEALLLFSLRSHSFPFERSDTRLSFVKVVTSLNWVDHQTWISHIFVVAKQSCLPFAWSHTNWLAPLFIFCRFLAFFLLGHHLRVSEDCPSYWSGITRKGSHVRWRVKKGTVLVTLKSWRDLDTKLITTTCWTVIKVSSFSGVPLI